MPLPGFFAPSGGGVGGGGGGGPRRRRESAGVVAMTNGKRIMSNVSLISAAINALITRVENMDVSK